jgi:hypothetical protein
VSVHGGTFCNSEDEVLHPNPTHDRSLPIPTNQYDLERAKARRTANTFAEKALANSKRILTKY